MSDLRSCVPMTYASLSPILIEVLFSVYIITAELQGILGLSDGS